MEKKAIINCSCLLTTNSEHELTPFRKNNSTSISVLKNAAIIFSGDKIDTVGEKTALEDQLSKIPKNNIINAQGKFVSPGLVDSHTHSVFFGSREEEYGMRIKGASYEEIAKAGGGILNTAKRVRECSVDDLVKNTLPFLDSFFTNGVTTIECKSGYGLSTDSEIKMLKAIKRLNEIHEIDLVPTFMGAHEVPAEYRDGKKEEYISLITEEMLPQVAEESLAEYCDVFCEKGVYTPDETLRILEAGRKYSMKPRFHADEIHSTGGAELAAEIDAKSADHLGAISDKGIVMMAASNTVATILPGTVMFLNLPGFAPARKLIDAGAIVAISTDFNPGSSPTTNLPLIMTLACSRMRMTPEETWAAVTLNAAYSIDRMDTIGSVKKGYKADLVIWDSYNPERIPYHYGVNLVQTVIKNGKTVYEKN